jgi:DNA-binding XRE family transcriptional regulator
VGKQVRPLHNQLALFRAERGLSRAALRQAGRESGNPQTIGFLERSRTLSLELGLKLAAVFGVPVETLFR